MKGHGQKFTRKMHHAVMHLVFELLHHLESCALLCNRITCMG